MAWHEVAHEIIPAQIFVQFPRFQGQRSLNVNKNIYEAYYEADQNLWFAAHKGAVGALGLPFAYLCFRIQLRTEKRLDIWDC
jgi:hypothetical protein